MPLAAAWSSRSDTSAAAFPRPPASSAARSDTRNTDHIVYLTSSLRSRAFGLRAPSASLWVSPGSVIACSSTMSLLSTTAPTVPHLAAPHLAAPHLAAPHLAAPHLAAPRRHGRAARNARTWLAAPRAAPTQAGIPTPP